MREQLFNADPVADVNRPAKGIKQQDVEGRPTLTGLVPHREGLLGAPLQGDHHGVPVCPLVIERVDFVGPRDAGQRLTAAADAV